LFSKSGDRLPAFILRELAFPCSGSSFFQALLIFVTEAKNHIHYARAGSQWTPTFAENGFGGFSTVLAAFLTAAALVRDVLIRAWCIKANFRRFKGHLHLCLLI
jgi:hypothetical protein